MTTLAGSSRSPGARARPAAASGRRAPANRLPTMSVTLPDEVEQVLDRFITTEYTTIAADGQPITWPVTPYFKPGAATVDVTTGLGYPKKANDARANPHIAMLFSEPNGSGLDDPPAVLVQGTATIDDA